MEGKDRNRSEWRADERQETKKVERRERMRWGEEREKSSWLPPTELFTWAFVGERSTYSCSHTNTHTHTHIPRHTPAAWNMSHAAVARCVPSTTALMLTAAQGRELSRNQRRTAWPSSEPPSHPAEPNGSRTQTDRHSPHGIDRVIDRKWIRSREQIGTEPGRVQLERPGLKHSWTDRV